ncbi:MAG: SDR family NAD(P)-dependent oxidoreductase [Alphaproteobacteria bacterium]|nr:SDR family NAD(P)-dependent oxidoreductase [Alphaproteobacteria bacterium]NCQ88761.1 SDR family NAD(P)-dependent oxidoreductase [Alphaproteobacteria bacterium]NCT07316.1 SDR family NAD(P)-dependent oxidoreductase [Alphaproteobacteria bacterium]
MLEYKQGLKIAVIGASGGIGQAFVAHLEAASAVDKIYAISRSGTDFSNPKTSNHTMDILKEDDIAAIAEAIKSDAGIDGVIVATGMLHNDGAAIAPEKSMRDINAASFEKIFAVNATAPIVVAKYFLPLLPREGKSFFAALSARVGSISDNEMGGWYAYRASKAALNMLIKNASIEFGRRYKEAVIVGLHPGTVKTDLSAPFQGNVPEHKLFTPEYAAQGMLQTLNGLTAQDTGKCFDYAGQEVPA